ncbi:head-to-tail stopper [Gordonia phage Santhid]|uniref:Head-to-tail stopper n=1 Tax=Gordonia phage Santhid TaxID=2927281 RepID=A0AAE9KES8_9CAUD|nr:head-to-tail stopper [Gordonia phage Santhid]UOK18005.1 head-to-tail stopper [Gordonia phage Santhid]
MSRGEPIIVHRGPRYDRFGNTIDGGDVTVRGVVAPGAASRWAESVRDGRSIAYTVFITGQPRDIATGDVVTITPEDLVTIRDARELSIVVNDWRSPWTARRGLELVALGGVG